MNYDLTDVVFVIEKSKSFKRYLPELMESYLNPAISFFSGGICEETDVYFTQCALARYAIVFFGTELSLVDSNNKLESMGPTTSQNSLMKAINNANYKDCNMSRQAYIMEALECASNVFKDLTSTQGESVKRCLILVTQSAPMLHPWCGRYESVLHELKMMGVKTSVICAHKIAELYKLFENAGGDLQSMSHKNYATKPQHMVLLNGFTLQERAISPSLANQSSLVNTGAVSNTGFMNHPTSSPTHASSPMGSQNQNNPMQPVQVPTGMPRPVQPNQMMSQNNMNPINPMQPNQRGKWPMGTGPMNPQPPQQMGMQQNPQMQNPNTQMGQGPGMQQNQMMGTNTNMGPGQSRPQVIWAGHLEWSEKKNGPTGGSNLLRLPCKITTLANKNEVYTKTDGWPSTLNMFLVQKELLSAVGNTHFANNSKVMFMFESSPALETLTNSLTNGQAGCVQLSSANTDVKIIVLLYSNEKKAFLGFIPADQTAFVAKINQVFQIQNKSRSNNVSNMPLHTGNFKQNVGSNMIQGMNNNPGVPNQNMSMMQNQGMNQPNLMVSNQMNPQMPPGMNSGNMNPGVNQVGGNQMNQMGGLGQNQSMNMGPGSGQMGLGNHQNQMGPSQSVLGNQLMRPSMGMNQQQPNDQMGVRQALHQGGIRQMQRPSMQMGMNQPRMLQSQIQNQGLRQILHQRLHHQQQQQQHQQQQHIMMMQQQQQGMRNMNPGQQGMNQPSMGQQNMPQQSMGQQISDDNTDYISML